MFHYSCNLKGNLSLCTQRSDNLGIHVRTAIQIKETLINIAEIFVIIGPLKAMVILYVDIPM